MTKICGNCINFILLPSCQKLHKAGSAACTQWSPDANKVLTQMQEEKQDKQTIALMIGYISEKCTRCPAYRANEKCIIDDCEGWLLEYFGGKDAGISKVKKVS